MSLGIETLVKSFGIDPEEIKKSIGEFGGVVMALKEQMDRIENKLDLVLAEKDETDAQTETETNLKVVENEQS